MPAKEPTTKIIYRDRPKKKGKRGGRRRGGGGGNDRELMGLYIAGNILGRLEQAGQLSRLPTVLPNSDPVSNAGILMYGAKRFGFSGGGDWYNAGMKAALTVGGYRAGTRGQILGQGGNGNGGGRGDDVEI